MIKSFLFRIFALSFIFLLLINSGYCVVTQEEIEKIRNEMLSSDDMVTKSNALLFCSLFQDKLQNSEEAAKAFMEFIKDERYKESQYGIMPLMIRFRFSEDEIKELLEMSPAIKERLGYQSWKAYMGAIAVSGGEKAYDPIIKFYNLDNATTETLLQYDWLLIKTGDMRSISRVLPMVESMPLNTCSYTRELQGVIGAIKRKVSKEKTEENMRLYNRCLKVMDKITSNESSHPEYIQRVCMIYSGMLLDPENSQFALQKLEDMRPVWKNTYYAKHIEFQIKKAVREEEKHNK